MRSKLGLRTIQKYLDVKFRALFSENFDLEIHVIETFLYSPSQPPMFYTQCQKPNNLSQLFT
jgi:hypothetical protein